MKSTDESTVSPTGPSSYRQARLRFQLRQFRKQWKIYYRSTYGKVGFYILLAFTIITLLTPVLQFHNPNTFFAPQEDAYVASLELNAHVLNNPSSNISVYSPGASALTTSGSYVLYTGTPAGGVYAVGLGGAGGPAHGQIITMFNVSVPAGGSMYSPLVFPMTNFQHFLSTGYQSIVFDNYIAVATTNGLIRISRIAWPGTGLPGNGLPYVVNNESYNTNYTVVLPPVSNALATTYGLPPWVPFDSSAAVQTGFANGEMFLVTSTNGSYYLRAYNDYPISLDWSFKLNGTALPSLPSVIGSYYERPSQVSMLIEQGSTITSLNPYSGNVNWQKNLSVPLNTNLGIYVPYGYQLGYNTFNKAFVTSGNSVYTVSVLNGSSAKVITEPAPITGIASSQAVAAPDPQYFLVQTATQLYVNDGLTNYTQMFAPVDLPASQAGGYAIPPIYNGFSRDFVAGTDIGNFISISPTGKQLTVKWGVEYASISHDSQISFPVLLLNSQTGSQSFAFMTAAGNVAVYSTSGRDTNPFPPTLHSPSGNVYLLGTNTFGNDIWSQLIASFAPDWEVGLGVAAITILISVIVAMIVGYLGGFVGSLFETLALVIFLIPGLALLIVVASILNPSLEGAIFVLSFVAWPFTTFTLIGLVRSIKSHSFIEAARVSGAKSMQILRRHMLSNMTPLLTYLTAISVGAAVGTISTLQFLGVVSITTVTWGAMLQPVLTNFYLAADAPWWILPPSVALTMFIFAFVFISRGLDEVVNPRLRRR